MSVNTPSPLIRRAEKADLPAILRTCGEALGWAADGPDADFFLWKHQENPFGESPIWVAEDSEGTMLGVRAFMRWRFVWSGQALEMVRAVDTATLPAAQGQGIFKKLTLGGLEGVKEDGIDAVFNTPNDQSRPGYLKMGWRQLGRVPIAARPASLISIGRMLQARTAAGLNSLECDLGISAPEYFSDDGGLQRLIDSLPSTKTISTDRSVGFYQWRYAPDRLRYRALPLGDATEDGAIIFRLRQRGGATEATICQILCPPDSDPKPALRTLLKSSEADYALGTTTDGSPRRGFLPVPRFGPILTWKIVNNQTVPEMDDLKLALGDVELF